MAEDDKGDVGGGGESTGQETGGTVGGGGDWLALGDVGLLGGGVAAEVAFDAEVEEEVCVGAGASGGWGGMLDEEGEGGDGGAFGGVGGGDEEVFGERDVAGVES